MPATFLAKGKIVGLRAPSLPSDVEEGGWADWFNSPELTSFLEHGVWPVSTAQQISFVEDAIKDKSKLLLAIESLEHGKLIGVISLTSINFVQRRAEIALVLSNKPPIGAALEAMALMTSHAFDRLNLDKIVAGQHASLWKWINTLMLIGYRIEGYREGYGMRNNARWNAVLTGITRDRFEQLRKSRNGDILAGDPVGLAKHRSSRNFVSDLESILDEFNNVCLGNDEMKS